MTVERGKEWGWPGTLPADAPIVRTDEQLHGLIQGATSATPLMVGLLGGSLWRTLGGGTDTERWYSGPATVVPVDLVRVEIGGSTRVFAAHLVARRRTWRGPIVAVMNAAHYGGWNPAPRAHPGDGRVELIRASLPLSDLLAARRRLPSGAHVPHPAIDVRSVRTASLTLSRGARIWLDGVPYGPAAEVDVSVAPGSLHVVV